VPNAERSKRVVAAELLPGSISLYALIRDNKTFQIPSLQQRGKGQGIVRLDDSLAELVRAGKTDLAQARVFAEAPEDFDSLVGQKGVAPQGAAATRPLPAAAPKKQTQEEQAMDLGGLLSRAGSLFGGKKA
jgi:twitching motility protein PilT